MPYITTPPRIRLAKTTPVSLWRLLHTVADASYPRLLRLWLGQLHAAHAVVDDTAVTALLAAGDVAGAEALLVIAWTTAGLGSLPTLLAPILQQTVAHGASAMRTAWPQMTGVTLTMRFDLQAPEAVAWLRRFGGDQIKQIDETTRTGIKALLTQGLEAQQAPAQTARQLRSQLGLTRQQQGAVATAVDQWRAAGKTEAQVTGLRERLAAQKVRQRADVIAHAESMSAANMGAHQMTLQARDAGWLPQTARRLWVTTGDSHVCEGCAAVPVAYPEGVGLDQPFLTDRGPLLSPPHDPLCRCTISISV